MLHKIIIISYRCNVVSFNNNYNAGFFVRLFVTEDDKNEFLLVWLLIARDH